MDDITNEPPAVTAAYAALGRELAERHSWLAVQVGESPHGGDDWCDVVLRLDGSFSRESAASVLVHFHKRLDHLIQAAGAAYKSELTRSTSTPS